MRTERIHVLSPCGPSSASAPDRDSTVTRPCSRIEIGRALCRVALCCDRAAPSLLAMSRQPPPGARPPPQRVSAALREQTVTLRPRAAPDDVVCCGFSLCSARFPDSLRCVLFVFPYAPLCAWNCCLSYALAVCFMQPAANDFDALDAAARRAPPPGARPGSA